MTNSYSGNYPIETRAGETERLLIQSAAMAPDTLTMLRRIGVERVGLAWTSVAGLAASLDY